MFSWPFGTTRKLDVSECDTWQLHLLIVNKPTKWWLPLITQTLLCIVNVNEEWKHIKWLPIIPPQPHIGNTSLEIHWKYIIGITLEIQQWQYIGNTSSGFPSFLLSLTLEIFPHIGNTSQTSVRHFQYSSSLNINRTRLRWDRFDNFYTKSPRLISGFF